MLDRAADALAGQVLEGAGLEDGVHLLDDRMRAGRVAPGGDPIADRLGRFHDRVRGILRHLHHRLQLKPAVARGGGGDGDELRDLVVHPRDLARQPRFAHVGEFHAGMDLRAEFGDAAIHEAAQLRQPRVELGPQRGAQRLIGQGGEGHRVHATRLARRRLPRR